MSGKRYARPLRHDESGYGKAAFEFANGKPIELLAGSNLLYLSKEHANIDAKIVLPEDG